MVWAITRSDLMLLATALCWAACTGVLCVQLEEPFASPGCYNRALLTLVFPMAAVPVVFLFISFKLKNSEEEVKDVDAAARREEVEASWFNYPHGSVGTAIRLARYPLLSLPFIFLVKAVVQQHGSESDVCTDGSVIIPLIAVILTGQFLLCYLMAFSSSYGIFLALLLGVDCVSFAKHYSHSDRYHSSYHSYLVFALSLLAILLCDIYLSFRAIEKKDRQSASAQQVLEELPEEVTLTPDDDSCLNELYGHV